MAYLFLGIFALLGLVMLIRPDVGWAIAKSARREEMEYDPAVHSRSARLGGALCLLVAAFFLCAALLAR